MFIIYYIVYDFLLGGEYLTDNKIVTRLLPLDLELFSKKEGKDGKIVEVNIRTKMKVAALYFWFRSKSTCYKKVEYLPFPNGKPYTNKELSKEFGYGINNIPIMMNILVQNNLIVIDKEEKRYLFPIDGFIKDNNYLYVHIDVLRQMLDYGLENRYDAVPLLSLMYLFRINKVAKIKNAQCKFTMRKILSWLGYDKRTKTDNISRILQYFQRKLKWITFEEVRECREDGSYITYNVLGYVKEIDKNFRKNS